MPAHYHVAHDETVYVRSGSGQLLLGTKEYRVTPGVLMHIPRGTVHRYVGDTVEPAVVVSILSPAMTGADFVVVPSRDAPAEVKRP
jgi:quercetin dioxygenase-like cupin family protein